MLNSHGPGRGTKAVLERCSDKNYETYGCFCPVLNISPEMFWVRKLVFISEKKRIWKKNHYLYVGSSVSLNRFYKGLLFPLNNSIYNSNLKKKMEAQHCKQSFPPFFKAFKAMVLKRGNTEFCGFQPPAFWELKSRRHKVANFENHCLKNMLLTLLWSVLSFYFLIAWTSPFYLWMIWTLLFYRLLAVIKCWILPKKKTSACSAVGMEELVLKSRDSLMCPISLKVLQGCFSTID